MHCSAFTYIWGKARVPPSLRLGVPQSQAVIASALHTSCAVVKSNGNTARSAMGHLQSTSYAVSVVSCPGRATGSSEPVSLYASVLTLEANCKIEPTGCLNLYSRPSACAVHAFHQQDSAALCPNQPAAGAADHTMLFVLALDYTCYTMVQTGLSHKQFSKESAQRALRCVAHQHTGFPALLIFIFVVGINHRVMIPNSAGCVIPKQPLGTALLHH